MNDLVILACLAYFGIGVWAGWLWRGVSAMKAKRKLLREAQEALLNMLRTGDLR